MPSRDIVTRFAPSPTGYLHIGGARTALFNWAFARRHGGTFILRMEDTDVARSSAESTLRIIEDLGWLGLEWDEGPPGAPGNAAPFGPGHDPYDPSKQRGAFGPYFQSQRTGLYRDYLEKLHQLGRAYRCFKSPEQLKAEREAQKASGRPMKYDPTESLGRAEADQQALIDQGNPFVWRFRMPDKDVTVHDLVLGDVTIKAEELEDFVIMKGEVGGGGPTFHFANVVDDATMRVTHVLRGQEHLMNTPKHVAMFDALGLTPPRYAHMPFITNPDGAKMSKREKAKAARAAAQQWLKAHGDDRAALAKAAGLAEADLAAFVAKETDASEIAVHLGAALHVALPEIEVHDFRKSGYLKEVLLNYVTLVGWSPGSNIEHFDLEYLKREFDIERLGQSNARFDRAKLLAFNAETLQKAPPEVFRGWLADHLREFHPEFRGLVDSPVFGTFAQAYQQRARTLSDPAAAGRFFIEPDDALVYDPKAVDKVLKAKDGAGLKILAALAPLIEACEPFTPPEVHKTIEDYANRTALTLGEVAQPLRVAVCGGTVSPPINDTLVILGRAPTLARMRACLKSFKFQV